MGVIAEKLEQMKCDMTVQVVSTPIAWSHSGKLTSKYQSEITIALAQFTLGWNKPNNYDFNKFDEILIYFNVRL